MEIIKFDLNELERKLGVPVVGTTARDKRTLEKLKDTIYKVCTGEIIPRPNEVEYSSKIEENIKDVRLLFVGKFIRSKVVDDDKICLTNLNRQLISTRKTIGRILID